MKEEGEVGLGQALEREAAVDAGRGLESSVADRLLFACDISPFGIIHDSFTQLSMGLIN